MNNLSLTRFDFIAKYLYIKYYEKNYKSNFYLDLYKKHIEVFNKCWEHPGTKTKIQDFINSFNKLIEYLKKEGFSKKYPIEVHSSQLILFPVWICDIQNKKKKTKRRIFLDGVFGNLIQINK